MGEKGGETIYSRNGIRLILGDSTKVLPLDEEVHLIITSPPYFAKKKGDIYPDLSSYRNAMRMVMKGCFDSLIEGGLICWNLCSHSGIHLTAYAAIDLEEIGFRYWREVVWRKSQSSGWGFVHTERSPYALNYNPNLLSERILIYSKGKKRPADKRFQLDMALARRFRTDVWHFEPVHKFNPRGENIVAHDSPFPHILPALCIEFFSLPGELVLDPFAGTATTLLAAAQAYPARRAVGIEILPEFAERAKRNLELGAVTFFNWQMAEGEKQ